MYGEIRNYGGPLRPYAENQLSPMQRLESAIKNGNRNEARRALTEGASPQPMLFSAIKEGCDMAVRALLEIGASPNSSVGNGNLMNWTYLHYAADYGNSDVVSTLLEFGADKNSLDSLGRTPLMVATDKGHTRVVCYLK